MDDEEMRERRRLRAVAILQPFSPRERATVLTVLGRMLNGMKERKARAEIELGREGFPAGGRKIGTP